MEGSPCEGEEAAKDPAAKQPPLDHEISDNEITSHRHLYVGFHVPGKKKGHLAHGGHRKSSVINQSSRGHHGHVRNKHLKLPREDLRPVTPPAQKVQFILGQSQETGAQEHESHPVFSEMEELFMGEDGDMEWKETARWVKFEEDVEEGGNRWSKPHVATLSLHSLFQLRSLLTSGTVCLDMEANSLEQIVDLTLDKMINTEIIPEDKRDQVKLAMLKKHRHQFEGNKKTEHPVSSSTMTKLPLIRSLAEIGKNQSATKSISKMKDFFHPLMTNNNVRTCPNLAALVESDSGDELNRNESDEAVADVTEAPTKVNSHFMKKIPKGAEASNILVGEVDFLEKPFSAFIRLQEAAILGDLTEVPVPTRFLFIMLGPCGKLSTYHEIGRSVATIMSDEVFHDVAYKAKQRDHLLAGLDEFLDAVTVLPPGEWDPSIRIEPPQNIPSQEGRKHPNEKEEQVNEEEEEAKSREESGLVRSGRFFGGLINDIKRKKPWFPSDFKDALSLQCIASYFFIYFACLTPIITFGGLLGDATGNNMASMESLVSGLIVGVTYGLFSGQPLTILGSTGPVLVFETIVYQFCQNQEWDYLSFRLWIGIWIGVILLVMVATDASFVVCYITRFTEENFATLIAVIFIIKAIEKVIHIEDKYPMTETPCFCDPTDKSLASGWNQNMSLISPSPGHDGDHHCEFTMNINGVDKVIQGTTSIGCYYVENAFLMSVLIFIGTYLISSNLKQFKFTNFFPIKVRSYISDFAVVIAIFSMTLTDMLMGIDTPKLSVPSRFAPTLESRGWVIPPFNGNPVWSSVIAIIPALLGSILIFMDQQITAVIVNRKEHKLIKGCGYHLDLLIVALLIMVCSIIGTPWFVAATVLSINHVRSLQRESESAAPGEKPSFLGIREQRVTHVFIFLTIGLSVFMTPILSKIPMPVLYGVFLYMGIASLNGLQFYDRILLMFMPKKYQPDYPYLRHVPMKRVHFFTAIQVGCFAALWLVKSFSQTSILFPLMLVIMIVVRKGLDFVFSKRELQVLDDILPAFKRHDRLDDEEALQQNDESVTEEQRPSANMNLRYTDSAVEVGMVNGKVMRIPHSSIKQEINITEEMNKSGVWKSLEPSAEELLDVQRRDSDEMKSTKDSSPDDGILMKVDKEKRLNEHGNEEEKKSLVSSENKED